MQCNYHPAVAFVPAVVSCNCLFFFTYHCRFESWRNPNPQTYCFTSDEVWLIKAASRGPINEKHQLGLLMRDN